MNHASMNQSVNMLDRIPLLNKWGLVLLISIPISLAMVLEAMQVGLTTPQAVSHMMRPKCP